MTVYSIADPTAALPAPFATMTADLDQSLFDSLAIGDKQRAVVDEIRFGDTAADVGLGVGTGPTAFQLTITPNASTSGNYDFSWGSQADKIYDLVSDTTSRGARRT